MAKAFFENFKHAGPVYPGITWGADKDGNIRSGGRIRNIYGPDPVGSYNTADYEDRVAVPFRYSTISPSSGDVYERKGILYIPYHESRNVFVNGQIRDGVNEIQAYGAEVYDIPSKSGEPMQTRSLNVNGLNKLINNPKNFGFSFDVESYDDRNREWGRSADIAQRWSGRTPSDSSSDTGSYQVRNSNFIKNLRTLLGNKEL